MPEPFTVFVIPHTHWDREWYATFQQYRIRLVHVIDALLALLEQDPSYSHFNLDAQTVVLQDYLEIRPEKREALKKFIEARRLGVGPWYVLPDEFLVSGESLVRNLLLGHRIAGDFGHVQKVGYLPDTFGHISQLPQILQGFGIPYAMHFRGLDEGNLKFELWWHSPDGSRVLLRHLPTDMGYANASSLAADTQAAGADLLAFAGYERGRAASSVLLALNGVDHLPAREQLPAIIAAANRQSNEDYHFQQGSLEEYFESLHSVLKDQPLQSVYGELRDANRTAGRDNRLLPHILSSRIYNKLQNERTQSLLERWAEPWSVLLWLKDEEYPQAFLWKSWEWLLQNHPHDSIGGCSIDAVQAQMETRFAWASEIAEEITGERFHLLARAIDLSGLKEDEAALVLFNGLPWPVEGPVTVDIDLWDFFLDRIAVHHWKAPVPEAEITPESSAPERFVQRVRQQWYDGSPFLPSSKFRGLGIRPLNEPEPLQVQVESIHPVRILRPLVSGPASDRAAMRVRASFFARIPAYGYQTFAVTPEAKPNKPLTTEVPPSHVLENEYLRVQISANGTFTLEDKVTSQVYRDLGYCEDGGDCGDGYNYSYPLEDQVESSTGQPAHISRLSAGPLVQRYRIDYDWYLPESLNDSRQARSDTRSLCPTSVQLSLALGQPRLDLQVSFDNRARDHRLRMLFPSDIQTESSYSGAQFDVVKHPIRVAPVPRAAWVEDAPTTFPQHDWVDLSDGVRGLCIISQGLPEYEVLDSARHEIAITLLRAVGFLGAGLEMQTTDVGAGPHIATPEAQIQRKLTYFLSVLPHTGMWDQAEVVRQALAHNTPPRAITTAMTKNQLPSVSAALPASQAFLSIAGANVVLSSLKKAEQGEAVVLRIYNPSDHPTKAEIQLPFTPAKVQLAGLDEQPQTAAHEGASLTFDGHRRVDVTLPQKKIVTLRMERG